MNTSEYSPYDIAANAMRDNEYGSHKETAEDMAVRALQHYENGHWAEARTAALVGKLFVELSYATS